MRHESTRGAGAGHEGERSGLEAPISVVLRWGVVLSAAMILVGIALYVAQAGPQAILFAPHGIPPGIDTDPASVRAVLHEVVRLWPAAVVDLGLLFLIVTPVLSVVVAAAGFAIEQDWTYVGLAVFVFVMLMVGFFIGQA